MNPACTETLAPPVARAPLPPLQPDWRVLELRRYTLRPGTREAFVAEFERHFPNAFLQSGAMLAGHFLDRDRPVGFTWLRAFRSMPARAIANAAFYYGDVWAEHRDAMNARLDDHTDVLLLRPLDPAGGVRVLPPLGHGAGDVATGIVVMLVLRLAAGPGAARDAVLRDARALFARGEDDAGVQSHGAFVTLEEPNSFPQLPVRTDGPYVVWIAVARDAAALARVTRTVGEGAARLGAGGGLQSPAEWSVLDPAPRSRARWWSPSPGRQ
jgi:hypothetical protein